MGDGQLTATETAVTRVRVKTLRNSRAVSP